MAGGSEQCILNTCVSAPPHMDCRYIDEEHCETIVNGGGGASNLTAESYTFVQVYILETVSQLLLDAGIRIGDGVTHVDISKPDKSTFPRSLSQFGQMAKRLRKGDRLFVYRFDTRAREWVTL